MIDNANTQPFLEEKGKEKDGRAVVFGCNIFSNGGLPQPIQ